MRKLLIATTNKGKVDEIMYVLKTQPFEILSLNDLDPIETPEEPYETIEQNAIHKAMYYGKKTGLLTLADDSGIFIDALNGWPGVHSARVVEGDEAKRKLVLEKMKDVPDEKRTASFQIFLALFDPEYNQMHGVRAETNGVITKVESQEQTHGFGYDPIFFSPELGKTFSEATMDEKNLVSHRGRALNKMKYILHKQYGGRHIIVPLAIIVKDGKILMNLRNDPHNQHAHRKWEFPGGSMEIGESVEENVIREAKEETGFDIEVIASLPVHSFTVPDKEIQLYLLPYVCKLIGGNGEVNDEEVLETKWFDVDEITKQDCMPENVKFFERLLPQIKETIKEHHL